MSATEQVDYKTAPDLCQAVLDEGPPGGAPVLLGELSPLTSYSLNGPGSSSVGAPGPLLPGEGRPDLRDDAPGAPRRPYAGASPIPSRKGDSCDHPALAGPGGRVRGAAGRPPRAPYPSGLAPSMSVSYGPRPGPGAVSSGKPPGKSWFPCGMPAPLIPGKARAGRTGKRDSSLFRGHAPAVGRPCYLEQLSQTPTPGEKRAKKEPRGRALGVSHEEKIERLKARQELCGSFSSARYCEGPESHVFVQKRKCRLPWCPKCREAVHRGRVASLLPKIKKMAAVGQLVLTCPADRLPKDVPACEKLTPKITGILKRRGFDRAIAAWHYFGDKRDGVWRPHVHVLLDHAYIENELLADIKKAWMDILGVNVSSLFGATWRDVLASPLVDIQYKFIVSSEKGGVSKILHRLRYVTRATFLKAEWAPDRALELYRARTLWTWGWFEDPGLQKTEGAEKRRQDMARAGRFEDAWVLREKKEAQIQRLYNEGRCPICKHTLGPWRRPYFEDPSRGNWREVLPGVFTDASPPPDCSRGPGLAAEIGDGGDFDDF